MDDEKTGVIDVGRVGLESILIGKDMKNGVSTYFVKLKKNYWCGTMGRTIQLSAKTAKEVVNEGAGEIVEEIKNPLSKDSNLLTENNMIKDDSSMPKKTPVNKLSTWRENRLIKSYLQKINYDDLNESWKKTIHNSIYTTDIDFEKIIATLQLLNKTFSFEVDITKLINEIDRATEKEKIDKFIQLSNGAFFDDAYKECVEFLHRIHPFLYDENGLFWLFDNDNKVWKIVKEIQILNLFYKYIQCRNDLVNPQTRTKILNSFKDVGFANKPKNLPPTWIQFKNIIINIETGEEIKPTSEYFLCNPIPWEHNPTNIETPTFDKLFKEWVEEKHIHTLYEILAYCLLPAYPIQIAFVLVGFGANGKSCMLKIINKFCGDHNVTTTELDDLMKSKFGKAKLYKKLVCVMGETNFNMLQQTSILKQIIGEDKISIEHKNKDAFDAYTYAKVVIATNTLPMTMDKTTGFHRRFFIIDFPNQFKGDKDVLLEIPEEEYSALAGKCIPILKKLYKDRKFTNSGSYEDRANKYEETSNPLLKFINKECVNDHNGKIFNYEFKDRFNAWLSANGYKIWSKNAIHTMMIESYSEGRQYMNNNNIERQYRVWLGIRWKSKEEKQSILNMFENDAKVKEEMDRVVSENEKNKNQFTENKNNLSSLSSLYPKINNNKYPLGSELAKRRFEEVMGNSNSLKTFKQKIDSFLTALSELKKGMTDLEAIEMFGLTEENIEQLKREGEIFEPKTGVLMYNHSICSTGRI